MLISRDGNLYVWTGGLVLGRYDNGSLPAIGYGNLVVQSKIGIGISDPQTPLHVNGQIFSTNGGFKFPDESIQTTAAKSYQVGDFAQGGIVFWVDESEQHGLVCATTDLGTRKSWSENSGYCGAFGDGPFAGEMNTTLIIAHDVAVYFEQPDFAAIVCATLQITEGNKTYGDWYLPSKEELNLIYHNKATIDATALANGRSAIITGYYWSSTEHSNSSSHAWRQYLGTGGTQIEGNKESDRSYVIAIRTF